MPQGSIPGPLHFILFISNLPSSVEAPKCNLYADDTAISVSAKSPDEMQVLNRVLLNAGRRLTTNTLTLNISETSFMVFGKHKALSKFDRILLMYNDIAIGRANTLEYLSIMLDGPVTFTAHVDYLYSKMNPENSIKLYNTLCVPIRDYSDVM